jgi:hypothetical protein
MVAWAATIPLFWMILGKTMKDGSLGKSEKLGEFISSWSWVLTLMSYLILIVLMLVQFWDYWITLI